MPGPGYYVLEPRRAERLAYRDQLLEYYPHEDVPPMRTQAMIPWAWMQSQDEARNIFDCHVYEAHSNACFFLKGLAHRKPRVPMTCDRLLL